METFSETTGMYIELNILLAVRIDCTDIIVIVGLDFRADCVHRICFSCYSDNTPSINSSPFIFAQITSMTKKRNGSRANDNNNN